MATLGVSRIQPFITCTDTIVHRHWLDCPYNPEWTCGVWLVVFKIQRATINAIQAFLFVLHVLFYYVEQMTDMQD